MEVLTWQVSKLLGITASCSDETIVKNVDGLKQLYKQIINIYFQIIVFNKTH